jgi:hypothetical protein
VDDPSPDSAGFTLISGISAAGFGLGRCAFFLALPDALPAELLHTLIVRRAGDGAALPMSEACREACGLAPALMLAA